jgi:hypothetical protein
MTDLGPSRKDLRRKRTNYCRKPAKLQRLLSDVLVDHVWMITTKDDTDVNDKSIIRRYYSRKEPAEDLNFVRFSALLDFNGTELARAIVKHKVIYRDLSPQSRIANRFNSKLADDSELIHWEALMVDLVENILYEPDLDPILQVALLRQVVDAATEASEPLRDSFAKAKNLLNGANVDVNVSWMNPDGRRPDRRRAAELVQSVRESREPRKQVLARRDQIVREVARLSQTVGWLARNSGGWQLRCGVALPREGSLWVVVFLEDKRGDWRKVGMIASGKPKIDAPNQSALAEGRPVFVITSSL